MMTSLILDRDVRVCSQFVRILLTRSIGYTDALDRSPNIGKIKAGDGLASAYRCLALPF